MSKDEITWIAEQKQTFETSKKEIRKTTVLRYFDPNAFLTAELGAALLQKPIPIALASKTQTGSETWYSNIKREILAIMFEL